MCGFYFNITNTSYKFDMILDRTWNKKEQKLVISYIDKEGNRHFYQKYFHHFKTYEYDENDLIYDESLRVYEDVVFDKH